MKNIEFDFSKYVSFRTKLTIDKNKYILFGIDKNNEAFKIQTVPLSRWKSYETGLFACYEVISEK